MAKRYRYAFAGQKEAPLGRFSFRLFLISIGLLLVSVIVSFVQNGHGGPISGGLCLFASLLTVYGFIVGVSSLSGAQYRHKYGIIGSIANGLAIILCLAIFMISV